MKMNTDNFEKELESMRKPIRRLCDLALFPKRIDIRGAEHFMREGPNVIVGNHIGSYKDVGLLFKITPRPIFFTANMQIFDRDEFSRLVKKHLVRHMKNFGAFIHLLINPLVAYIVHYVSSNIAGIGSIPVRLDGSRAEAVRKCEAYLRKGRAVITLQGRGRVRSREANPYVTTFRRGPAVMAFNLKKTDGLDVPITPMSFFGTHRMWSVPGTIRVNVGPPLYIRDHWTDDAPTTIETFRSAVEATVVTLFRDSLMWTKTR